MVRKVGFHGFVGTGLEGTVPYVFRFFSPFSFGNPPSQKLRIGVMNQIVGTNYQRQRENMEIWVPRDDDVEPRDPTPTF